MLKSNRSRPTGYDVDTAIWEELGLPVVLPYVKPDSELGWLGITLMSRVEHEEEVQDVTSLPTTKREANTINKSQFAAHSWAVYYQMITTTRDTLQEEPGYRPRYHNAVAGAYRATRDWLEGESLDPFVKPKLAHLARFVSTVLLEEENLHFLHFTADTDID